MDPASSAPWIKRAYDGIREYVATIKGLGKENRELYIENRDLRRDLRAAEEEVDSLRRSLRQLQDQAESGDDLIYQGSVVYFQDETGQRGPYCPNCWHTNHRRVDVRSGQRGHQCDVCSKYFPDPERSRGRSNPGPGRRGSTGYGI